jgi:hypothetical protein
LFIYNLAMMFHRLKSMKANNPCPKDYSIVQNLHEEVNNIIKNVSATLRIENPHTSWDF